MSVSTCAGSLIRFGQCCVCGQPATVAILWRTGADLVEEHLQECSRCDAHADRDAEDVVASKPFKPSPEWSS